MHEGHRERVREKYKLNGLQGFADHEVLELLLFYANKRGDTNETAHRLIASFGSLSAVMEAPYEELIKIKGVGEKVAQCTLLYGCGKVDAFPIDVWVKRILAEDYPDGLPECINGTRGIAQQYLFHWKRTKIN